MPPISWTSKWRIPRTRPEASRHDGERLGQEVVELLALVELLAELDRLVRGAASSVSAASVGPSSLISATNGRMRFISRSFRVPTIFRTRVFSMNRHS